MTTMNENIDALIVRYLSGQASPEEATRMTAWFESSPQNKRYFEDFEKTFALTYNEPVFKPSDTHQAWIKTTERLTETQDIKKYHISPSFYYVAASVAIIMFALGMFINYYINNKLNPIASDEKEKLAEITTGTEILSASSTVKEFLLNDNSKIELKHGSILTIYEGYNSTERRLSLKGSGIFEVVHNEAAPFIVEVGKLEVVDLGTIFSITSFNDTVKVVVSEGAVELRINDVTMNVQQGDSAFYLVSRDIIKRFAKPDDRKDKVFVFTGTTLKDAAEILGTFFNRKIVVMDDAIANCKLSVTFKNEDLATILDVIKELLNVKIIQNDEIIGIYGENCL